MMPTPFGKPASDHEKSEYRLLYVGQDAEWYRRLRSELGLRANRLVYCPGLISAKLYLKSGIRYDLLLLDFDLLNETGLELVCLVRSLPHRQCTPIIIVAAEEVIDSLGELARSAGAKKCVTKTENMKAAVETIQRLLRAKMGL